LFFFLIQTSGFGWNAALLPLGRFKETLMINLSLTDPKTLASRDILNIL